MSFIWSFFETSNEDNMVGEFFTVGFFFQVTFSEEIIAN
jgi:hypothetical protein